MRKAEERALQRFPSFTSENLGEVANARRHFAEGYEQALKDIGQEEDIEFFFEPYE